MNEKLTLTLLKKFLISKKAYHNFFNNYHGNGKYSRVYSNLLQTVKYTIDKEFLIMNIFNYFFTIEGVIFWSNLQAEWYDLIKKIEQHAIK